MTRRAIHAETEQDRRHAIIAALYGDRPPPGASPEILQAWICRQADRGRSDQEISEACGWDIDSIRRAVGERRKA